MDLRQQHVLTTNTQCGTYSNKCIAQEVRMSSNGQFIMNVIISRHGFVFIYCQFYFTLTLNVKCKLEYVMRSLLLRSYSNLESNIHVCLFLLEI